MADKKPARMVMYVTTKIIMEVTDPDKYINPLDIEEEQWNVESNMDYSFVYEDENVKIVDTEIIDSQYHGIEK